MCAKAGSNHALHCLLNSWYTSLIVFFVFPEFLVTTAWGVSLHGLLMAWNHLGYCTYYFLTIAILQNFYLCTTDSKSAGGY